MRRLTALMLASTLGIAAATSLASCGGGENAKLLPGATAQEITENLDLVKQYAEEGECVGAADAVGEVSTQVEALNGVDPKLKQALQRGAARLGEVIATCEESSTEAVAPASEATTEGKEQPPGQEKKAEKEREKEEKEAEKQEPPGPPTTPTETTPEEPPAPPNESGGTGAPGGVSPGAPAAPGGE